MDPVFQKQTFKTAVMQMICSGSAPGEARRARERKKSGKEALSREVPVCLEEKLLGRWALILPAPVLGCGQGSGKGNGSLLGTCCPLDGETVL